MTVSHTIPCFNLKQIAESGQCFRMNPLPPEILPKGADYGYRIISHGRILYVWQKKMEVFFDCDEMDTAFWLHYFDIDTDYQAIINSISPKDSYLTAASQAGSGIRILCQDPWEMIITFVISQQKTSPKNQRTGRGPLLCIWTASSPRRGTFGISFPSGTLQSFFRRSAVP